ncbi:unnamed protein product [Parnassius apollo]|uniref:(apollo) hypothetical protein n=1 Tax=Parnassius apollo TaxID=110799 RepID=A0A8S3X8Y9_PARAO|nr:unnamed protein product [Parnassius apollo]
MDKPWRARSELSGAHWDSEYDLKEERHRNWSEESTTSLMEKDLVNPQPRVAISRWDDNGNVWSAALGALAGAGTVLIFIAILLLWRKPRRVEPPTLAPMDIGQKVSTQKFCTQLEKVTMSILC